jgi:hypothetical protein
MEATLMEASLMEASRMEASLMACVAFSFTPTFHPPLQCHGHVMFGLQPAIAFLNLLQHSIHCFSSPHHRLTLETCPGLLDSIIRGVCVCARM